MIPEKQAPAVVDAVAQARAHIPQLRAAIIGNGPEREAVLAKVADLQLEDAVDVPGFIDSVEWRFVRGFFTVESRGRMQVKGVPAAVEVFELLSDPRTYGYWVVGSREIRAADPNWLRSTN